MDFGFSPEQDELRDTLRQFFAKHAAAVKRRAIGDFDKPLWTKLTQELGLTALAVDEAHGGFGASLVEVAIAVEEAGRVLLAVPYLSTVATAAVLSFPVSRAADGRSLAPAAAELLGRIADGTAVATLAIAEPGTGWDLNAIRTTARASEAARGASAPGDVLLLDGVKEHVMDGDVADVVVVAAVCDREPGLFAVSAGDLPRVGLTTVDQTRPVARLVLDATPAVRVDVPGDGAAAVGYALDILHTLLAIESIGVASASLDLTTAYLNTREQFGVKLATFQALRHRVADLVVSLEAATSTAWYAVRTASVDGAELPVVAPMAKLVAAEAAYQVAAESIQLHGSVGFTWEYPVHRYFKRASVTRLSFCDEVALRRLIGSRAHLR